MNIFVLDLDPRKAAQAHCDKHVVKMVMESAQLLSTAHHISQSSGPLKLTHANHPCAKWARASVSNYYWLVKLFKELLVEYVVRYGREHAYQRHYETLSRAPSLPLSIGDNFVQVMPDQYKQPNDPVAAYRAYYKAEKARFARWERGVPAPEWWTVI